MLITLLIIIIIILLIQSYIFFKLWNSVDLLNLWLYAINYEFISKEFKTKEDYERWMYNDGKEIIDDRN